jgi:hypothetical protein
MNGTKSLNSRIRALYLYKRGIVRATLFMVIIIGIVAWLACSDGV